MDKFKLMRTDDKKGVWIPIILYLRILKTCKTRNEKLYNDLVEKYEFLTDKKFNDEELKYV